MAIDYDQFRQVVAAVLNVDPSDPGLGPDEQLMGARPEFDSMAVVSLVMAFEDELGVQVDEETLSAEDFETMGTLHALVCRST